MKWLVLLSLLACGKHHVPPVQDLGDADGDQILNKLEEGEAKFFAEVEALPPMTGMLSFTLDQHSRRFIRLEFATQRDLKADTLKLLTYPHAEALKEDHFAEWSRLRFKESLNIGALKEAVYEVSLNFALPLQTPTAVLLKQAAGARLLGSWKQNMKLNLSATDLEEIISGKSHLLLSNAWLDQSYLGNETRAESLPRQTYRVFYQNGEESKVLYVSKILSFKRLQQLLNIEHAQNTQEQEDLISPVEFNLESWWYRDLGEDKVLLYAPTEIVAKAFRSGLQKTDLRLQRLNGQATVDSKLTKADHSQIYLVINAFNTERIFRERKERLVHTEMRGRELGQVSFHCDYIIREVAQEHHRSLGWEEVWEQLEVRVDGQLMNWNEVFLTKQRETTQGPQLILGLRTTGKEVQLSLKNRPAQTFVLTGRISHQRIEQSGWSYLTTCHPNQNIPLNTEAKLEMNIEAYVEML